MTSYSKLWSYLLMMISLLPRLALATDKFVADFAIYNTPLNQSDDGVWKQEVQALKRMLDLNGWTYLEIYPQRIISGALGEGNSLHFRGLIMPGGYSVPRQWALGPVGKKRIEDFVKSGGTYIGFCAGSFYASQDVDWAEETSDPVAKVNLRKDYQSYHNIWSPDLLPGRAIGPFQWTPWKVNGERTVATGLAPVQINLAVPAMEAIGMPSQTQFFYLGGPFFQIPEEKRPQDLEVWAETIGPSAQSPSPSVDHQPDAKLLGESQPTVIKFGLEKGKVILFSYHPVMLMGGNIDGIQVKDALQSEKSVFNSIPAPLTLNETNYYSWNILYAAFAIASGRELRPMPRLKLSVL